MNILQVANKAFFPPDGGSLAILSLSKGYLENGHDVHILNMKTHKHSNKTNDDNSSFNKLKISEVDVTTKISIIRLIINLLFSKKPYIAERFISKDFSSKLVQLIKNNNFDFIQIEGLYCLQYIHEIRKIFNRKIIYRPHNIEYLIWERNYKESNSIFKKLYFKSLSKRLKNLEKQLINSYDYIIPISSTDANSYSESGNKKPMQVAPFGVDTREIQASLKKDTGFQEQCINYIGALDWIPNQNGLLWFIEECFPIILKEFPSINLKIAGRNAPSWFKEKLNHPNIIFVGEVENAYDFIQNSGPIIVPLFSGSGMRVKIIESMALGKAIVATQIAADGINCQHGNNILLANDPINFAKSVVSFLNNIELQRKIGDNAFKLIKENYDYIKIATNILKFIN